MDYDFFASLTTAEASGYLDAFIRSQAEAVESMRPLSVDSGVLLDYSIATLSDVAKWMMQTIGVHRVPVPLDEPTWIRQAHAQGLTEFNEGSKAKVLCAAYYFGECFARLPGFGWKLGDEEFLYKRMPVVAGFRFEKELPPLVVVPNLFARILGDGAPITILGETIDTWQRFVGAPQ